MNFFLNNFKKYLQIQKKEFKKDRNFFYKKF